MALLLSVFVLLCLPGVLTLSTDCTAVTGCTCEGSAVTCRGVTSLPAADQFTSIVTDFTFIDCDLPTLDSVPYTTAKQLNIINNKVKVIQDGAFASLTQLVDLDLSGNLLTSVRADIFQGLGGLEKLSLSNNNVTSLQSGVFNFTTSITMLMLAENLGLHLSDNSLTGLTQLSFIDLQTCGMSEVPLGALQSAPSLTRVSLNGNPLLTLTHHAFHGLHQLQEVNLDSCQLADLGQAALGGLPSLKTLQLSNNQLVELTRDTLGDTDTVTQIYLEVNQLTSLPRDLLDWSQVTHLSLHDNPWTCDCSTAWMSELDPEYLTNTKCASPEEVFGESLVNVTSQLSCPCGGEECGGTSVLALGIAIPILIICFLLIGYYMYKIWQARRSREAKRKSVRYSAVYKDTVENAPKGAKGYRGAGSEC